MTVDGPALARAIAKEVQREIELLPEFDESWRRQLSVEAASLCAENDQHREKVEGQLLLVTRQVDNLVNFIADGERSESVAKRLRIAESHKAEINDALEKLERHRPQSIQLPSRDELCQIAHSAFANLAIESQEFGALMRTVIDDLYVLPYRVLEIGQPQPRCGFKLNLSTLLAGTDSQVLRQLETLNVQCVVDLTVAPQYERIRPDVVAMRSRGMKEKQIATQLDVTVTAVQHAASLQRKMDALGLTSAWEPILTEEAVKGTFKRVHHPRYQFQPLSGFGQPRGIEPQNRD